MDKNELLYGFLAFHSPIAYASALSLCELWKSRYPDDQPAPVCYEAKRTLSFPFATYRDLLRIIRRCLPISEGAIVWATIEPPLRGGVIINNEETVYEDLMEWAKQHAPDAAATRLPYHIAWRFVHAHRDAVTEQADRYNQKIELELQGKDSPCTC